MHPLNRFRSGYDFERLVIASTALGPFVKPNGHGQVNIDFADPRAVKALNQALLKEAYGLEHWDLPPGYLCPPIPGRCDYLHHLADLIGRKQGAEVRVLDVGTGANCIYPLIGACEFGWSFVKAHVISSMRGGIDRAAAANSGLAVSSRNHPRR
jgi:23S rRNA (adenine1618-N6)-methyltransferase